MIVRQKPNALKVFFYPTWLNHPEELLSNTADYFFEFLITAIQHRYPSYFSSYGTAPFILLGVALLLFLGFRNNASYQRWWEARGLWGQLVFDARSLTRQVTSFIDDDTETGRNTQRQIIHLTIAFTHALRHRLRDTSPWEDVERFVEPKYHASMRQTQNLPDYIMRLMGKKLGDSRRQWQYSELMVQNIDEHLTSMTIVLAACERIHNTPLPFAYILLAHRTTYLYCFMLPFGLAANQLPLTALSRTIEINLLEALREGEPLPAIIPENGYLQCVSNYSPKTLQKFVFTTMFVNLDLLPNS